MQNIISSPTTPVVKYLFPHRSACFPVWAHLLIFQQLNSSFKYWNPSVMAYLQPCSQGPLEGRERTLGTKLTNPSPLGWYSDHVPSMDSARESWALLVTGRLVNTLLVNQITKENIRKGIWLQRKKKTLGAAKPSTSRTRVHFTRGSRVTSRDSAKRACSKPNGSQSQ